MTANLARCPECGHAPSGVLSRDFWRGFLWAYRFAAGGGWPLSRRLRFARDTARLYHTLPRAAAALNRTRHP